MAGLFPPHAGGGLEPVLEWFSRGVGVKAWQTAIAAYEHVHPHPNLPPARGKEFFNAVDNA